jgi:hypothetical protein
MNGEERGMGIRDCPSPKKRGIMSSITEKRTVIGTKTLRDNAEPFENGEWKWLYKKIDLTLVPFQRLGIPIINPAKNPKN